MRYLILIGNDEKGGKNLSPDQHQGLFAAYQKYEAELRRAGVLLGGEPLQSSESAVRISSEGGQRKLVDGPFSESKEIIGGYLLLDVKSRDEAIEWASRTRSRPACIEISGPARCMSRIGSLRRAWNWPGCRDPKRCTTAGSHARVPRSWVSLWAGLPMSERSATLRALVEPVRARRRRARRNRRRAA